MMQHDQRCYDNDTSQQYVFRHACTTCCGPSRGFQLVLFANRLFRLDNGRYIQVLQEVQLLEYLSDFSSRMSLMQGCCMKMYSSI